MAVLPMQGLCARSWLSALWSCTPYAWLSQPNLKRAYGQWSEELLDSCAKQAEFRAITFALAYFHAALLERKKFGVGNLPGATSGAACRAQRADMRCQCTRRSPLLNDVGNELNFCALAHGMRHASARSNLHCAGIGWNMNYPFNTGDQLCCGQCAVSYLDASAKARRHAPPAHTLL